MFAWVVTLGFAFLSVWIITANTGLVLWVVCTRRRKSVSLVPLVGGLLDFAACVVCPTGKAQAWCWVPLILDVSVPFLLLGAVIGLFKKGP